MKMNNNEPNDIHFQEDLRFDKFSKIWCMKSFYLSSTSVYNCVCLSNVQYWERKNVYKIIKEYYNNKKRDEIVYNFEARVSTSKVTREHIKSTKDYIRRWKGQHFTVAMVKNLFCNNTDFDNLLKWHISKILKTYLNYSYKKPRKMNIKVLNPVYIEDFTNQL